MKLQVLLDLICSKKKLKLQHSPLRRASVNRHDHLATTSWQFPQLVQKSSLQAHQDTWEHFTLTHAPSFVKHPFNSDHPSSASCKPSPSPYTDFASIPAPNPLALGRCCLSNHASSRIGAYNKGTTPFHHQLENCHCLFITPVFAEPWGFSWIQYITWYKKKIYIYIYIYV
jgi:hypothetical protein